MNSKSIKYTAEELNDATVLKTRKYIAQKFAAQCIPIDGLATAEGDDGDTASMTVALHSPVAYLGGRRGIKSSRGREEEMRVDIKKDNLCENEREACALDVSNTVAGSPSTNTETCSPNIDVAPTSISEYLLVTTARF
jgi:hypothetical protein